MAKMTEVILSEQCSVDSQDSSGSNKIQSNAAEEETKTVDGEVEQLTEESIEEKKDHVSDLAQTMEVQENITTNADSSSSTTGTTMLATSEISLTAATATSPVANTVGEAATVVLAEGVANLKRPTTLALKCKSTPRNPKCNFLLSSSKCLYHNTKVDKKRNIFVRLTSLGKEKNVITSVALKTSVTRSQSEALSMCELEAATGGATVVLLDEEKKKKKPEVINVKLPTPVANNHATAAALAAGHNRIDLFDDDDTSLGDEVVSTLKLNVLIGIVVLLVVSAVGTAMLLSISKIWGNHRNNVWLENQAMVMKGLDRYRESNRDADDNDQRLLHPKDLSSILYQYEMARSRHNHHKGHLHKKFHHQIIKQKMKAENEVVIRKPKSSSMEATEIHNATQQEVLTSSSSPAPTSRNYAALTEEEQEH